MLGCKQCGKLYPGCFGKNVNGRAQIVVDSGRICDQPDAFALQFLESIFSKDLYTGLYNGFRCVSHYRPGIICGRFGSGLRTAG